MSLDANDPITARGFVPVIDLSLALGGENEHRQRTAVAIDEACRTSGFLVVTGHGVPGELIERLSTTTLALFHQGDEYKDALSPAPNDPTLRGIYRRASYVSASRDIDTPSDLCELYTMNRLGEPGVAETARLGDAFPVWSLPNRWPTVPADFRTAWLDYYAAMESLSDELMRLFALALGIDESWFSDKIDNHITNLTANWYPRVASEPLPGQYRKGPHSDWGTFTVLYHDGVPGLQVRNQSDEWLDVPNVAGSFIVNLGDMLAVWTNDRWVSTVHRVLAPVGPWRDVERVSFPFFHTPNWDAVIECIPSCATEAAPARYEPVTAGDYLQSKIEKAYT